MYRRVAGEVSTLQVCLELVKQASYSLILKYEWQAKLDSVTDVIIEKLDKWAVRRGG